MKKITAEEQQILDKLMAEYHLTPESTLIRYTGKRHLKEEGGTHYLMAKKEPIEMVVDRYHGFWEVFNATEIGQGISFLSEQEEEYESDERVCVEVKLGDILNQGGLVYSVTSLPSYIKAFFCTLPEGKVRVTVID